MPVVGRLDQFGSMMVTGEFNEIGYSTITGIGESSFTSPGTYSWVVPTDVVSITAVAVGGGAGGGYSRGTGGGGGGSLAYVNHIPVTPGETLTVGVGTSGRGQSFFGASSVATDGGNSYLKRGAISLVEVGGGKTGSAGVRGAGGVVIVGTGGTGGAGNYDRGGGVQACGGGGAGGYSGAGGDGYENAGGGSDGSGGGGGGGGVSQGGGGVGLYGEGASGASFGFGGSGGSGASGLNGGLYGGGGGGPSNTSGLGGNGGVGAVRIIWGLGLNRYFPVNNTADLTNVIYAKAGISGLGTYTALEFIENIGTATTLTANVFAPYDLVYDEFGGVLFGPGQGRFMRQNLTGDVIVYNEIDEVGLSTSYGIAPESLSIGEGGTITFTISANNVPDGTEIYYEIV
jgi:hypothetical protein